KLRFEVTLRHPAEAQTQLAVTVVDGTATGGVDYKEIRKPKNVTFKPGQVQKSVVVTTFPDLAVELDESVDASISTSPLPVLPIEQSARVVRLNDDGGSEPPPVPA